MQDKKFKANLPVWTMSLLIAGNAIGAGMLGLPIKTGLAGTTPSVFGMIVIWVLMLATGWIIARQMIHSNCITSDLPSLFQRELGICGKWLAIAGYFVVFYGVLVAYLAGASSILASLVPLQLSATLWLLIFFTLATGLTLFGPDMVRKWNAILMFILGMVFLLLLIEAGENVETDRFYYTDWHFIPSAMPIIVCAFAFHNIIPTVCRGLKLESRPIWRALLIGTLISLVLNVLWTVVVIGAIPLVGEGEGNLLAAFEHDLPAIIPLSLVLHSGWITILGMVFALVAIMTSYLAVGTGLMGFLQDVTSQFTRRNNRSITAGLAFGPPLAIVLIYPNLFLKALDLVGGVGILLLFGILPGVTAIKEARKKSLWLKSGAYVLLSIFALLMLLEVAHELGCLRMVPNVEYWHSVPSP